MEQNTRQVSETDTLTLFQHTDADIESDEVLGTWYIICYPKDDTNENYASGLSFPQAMGLLAEMKAETYCTTNIHEDAGDGSGKSHIREIFTDMFNTQALARKGFEASKRDAGN